MSLEIKAFTPNSSYTLAATATSQNQVLSQPTNALGTDASGYSKLYICNNATNTLYLQPGMSSQTAVLGSPWMVPPGQVVTFELGAAYTNLGYILSSSTGYIFMMLGN